MASLLEQELVTLSFSSFHCVYLGIFLLHVHVDKKLDASFCISINHRIVINVPKQKNKTAAELSRSFSCLNPFRLLKRKNSKLMS